MKGQIKDLTQKRFGKLLVIGLARREYWKKGKSTAWVCLCDCGNIKVVYGYLLSGGNVKSCGCSRYRIRNNLAQQRFGRLLVVGLARPSLWASKSHPEWACLCDCGNYVIVRSDSLLNGVTKSCGCLWKKLKGNKEKYHRLYTIWESMRDRIYNQNCRAYKNYGGRGISICKEWDDFLQFKDWALTNGYNDELTLERINVDGNYEPANCCWIPLKQQNRNKRNTTKIEYKGQTKSITEWAEEYGMQRSTLHARLNIYGWDLDSALNTPIKNKVRDDEITRDNEQQKEI